MANTYTLGGLFRAIADAIREKTNTTDSIPASEFPERINSMEGKNLFVEIATGEVTTIESSDLEGLTNIPAYAFSGCDKLTTVTLSSSITSIDNNAFYECNNLKTINVPWTEGAISNAPWGATNATINYNYGGE